MVPFEGIFGVVVSLSCGIERHRLIIRYSGVQYVRFYYYSIIKSAVTVLDIALIPLIFSSSLHPAWMQGP